MSESNTAHDDEIISSVDMAILMADETLNYIEGFVNSELAPAGLIEKYKKYLKGIISTANTFLEDKDEMRLVSMVSIFMELDSMRGNDNSQSSSILGVKYLQLRGLMLHLKDLLEIYEIKNKFEGYDETSSKNVIAGRLNQLEKRQKYVLNSIDSREEKYNKRAAERELKLNANINSRLQEAIDLIASTQMSALKTITEKESELIKSTKSSMQEIDLSSQLTLSEFISDTKAQSDVLRSEIEQAKKECIDSMHKDILQEIRLFAYARGRLNQLLDAAGNDVLAKDNLKQAGVERKSANTLRTLGFIFLLFSVGYIAIEIGKLVSGSVPVTLELVLIRLIVTLVLMVPSVYLLKESARHRSDEREFRKKGIHLATIDSYLANFDDASKVEMKKQLTASFFDNKDIAVDYSTITDMNSSLTKLLEAFVEKVNKEAAIPLTASIKQEASSTK